MPQSIESIDDLIRKYFSRGAESLSRNAKRGALEDLIDAGFLEGVRKHYYQLPTKEVLRFRTRKK